jgi:hypothetical protein
MWGGEAFNLLSPPPGLAVQSNMVYLASAIVIAGCEHTRDVR